jgi:DNA-3-methyladenine glycosylase I
MRCLLTGRGANGKNVCAKADFLPALAPMNREPQRCPWPHDELYKKYHDEEWGVPCHDNRHLFEMLILEGAQAGLSWYTVLKKRERYREVFDEFDAEKIVRYDARKVTRLLADPGIIRNRLKIAAAIQNAKVYLTVSEEFGSFDQYIWQFIGGKPRQNHWNKPGQVPAKTAESDAMSKDLSKRGFKFVGSTICYAYMQATGMVNDHFTDCFRYKQVRRLGQA